MCVPHAYRNYVTSFSSYIQPFPNWYVLGPNIQYFAAHGVRGIFEGKLLLELRINRVNLRTQTAK